MKSRLDMCKVEWAVFVVDASLLLDPWLTSRRRLIIINTGRDCKTGKPV